MTPEARNRAGPHTPSAASIRPPASRTNTKLRTDKQPHARGGAKAAILHNKVSSRPHPTSPRHLRHRQPPARVSRMVAKVAGTQDGSDSAQTVTPQVELMDGNGNENGDGDGDGTSASLPPSSPAKDLLRRARATADADTDWLGRRPCIMDLILDLEDQGRASRPPAALAVQHGQEYEFAADESQDYALPAALRPVRSVCALEHARSLALFWDAQTARSHLPLAAGEGGLLGAHAQVLVPEYQVSAERSTVSWAAGDEDAGRSPPSE